MPKPFTTFAKQSLKRIVAQLGGNEVGGILVRGASVSFIVKVLGTGVAFGVQVLLARVMGVEHYGVYIYVITWLNLLVLVAKMGWDTALLRYIAAYNAQAQWGAFRGILQSSHQFVLLTSLAVSGGMALAVWELQNQLKPELTYTFWMGSAVLPFLTLTDLRQATLRALRHIAASQFPEDILRPLLLALLVGIVAREFAQPVSGFMAMALLLLAATISFGVGTYYLTYILPESVKNSTPQYQHREWVSVALPLFLISGMYLVLSQTDTIMIGAILGTKEAGIYSIASRIANLMLFGLTAVNAIAAPMVSQMYASDKRSELQRLITLASRSILAFSIPVGLVLIVFGNEVLAFFSPGFAEGYLALVILIAGQLVNALAGPVGCLMIMTQHQREAAGVMGSSAVLNILLNAVLIPFLGMTGAAMATALTTALWNIAMLFYVKKHLNIEPTIFAGRK